MKPTHHFKKWFVPGVAYVAECGLIQRHGTQTDVANCYNCQLAHNFKPVELSDLEEVKR